MNIFTKLLFPSLSTSSEAKKEVKSYLKVIRFYSQCDLPQQYQSLLEDALLLTNDVNGFLKQLVNEANILTQSLGLTKSVDFSQKPKNEKEQQMIYKQLLKILTIIICLVRKRSYDRQQIDALCDLMVGKSALLALNSNPDSELQGPKSERRVATERVTKKQQQNQVFSLSKEWLNNLINCFLQYLIKLPSMCDIYQQCHDLFSISALKRETPPAIQLTHIFRIIQQVQIILKWFHNAVNVVGRYHGIKFSEFRELYKVTATELSSLHNYMRYLITNIFDQYKVYDVLQLQCFIKVLPQVELTSDKIEDVLVNKYFKGSRVVNKIEIKEEKVAQLMYYLEYQYQGDSGTFSKSKVKNDEKCIKETKNQKQKKNEHEQILKGL